MHRLSSFNRLVNTCLPICLSWSSSGELLAPARPRICAELQLLSVPETVTFGGGISDLRASSAVLYPRSYTLGGLYLARYDDSPVGAFDEARCIPRNRLLTMACCSGPADPE